MITSYIYALLGVAIVSLISLIGVFALTLKEDRVRKYTSFLVSLAVGALLGDVFIHLIPEAFENFADPLILSLLIIGGIVLFFALEKFLHWHHHDDDTQEHEIHPMGKLVLISDGLHNFIDGIIIGVSFLLSIPLGIATTLAVILHEIPQELGDFAVLLHSGYTRRRALWLNFLSALMALLGALLAFVLREVGESFTNWILPLAAGGFIYVAMSDLIPELHKTKKISHSFFQLLAIVLGVILMVGLTFLE